MSALDGPGPPSPISPPIVELIGISKAYPGVQANDDISLSLRAGEVHCLFGENGAGKSTLVGILSGLVRPDAGRVRVDGVEVSIDSPRTALELGVGTVYQHSTLIPAMTVLENLMLGDTRRCASTRRGRESGSPSSRRGSPSRSTPRRGRSTSRSAPSSRWRSSRRSGEARVY